MAERRILVATRDYESFHRIIQSPEFAENPGLRFCAQRLQEKLEDATILPIHELPDDVIVIDSKVQVRDILTNAMWLCCSLDWKGQSIWSGYGGKNLQISPFTALGAALFGQRSGDVIETGQPSPGHYEILDVSMPERRPRTKQV